MKRLCGNLKILIVRENKNVKCRIVEVHEDYCVAHTEGNHNGYDDMRLCIEASNEENFHRI